MLKGIVKSEAGTLSEDRYGTLLALSRLAKTMSGANTESAYVVAAETGCELLRVPMCVVFVKNPGGELAVGGSMGIESNHGVRLAALEIAQEVVASSGSIISHVSSNTGQSQILAQSGLASALCVPMRVDETNVGAVAALSDVPRTFSPTDVELLHVVASQVAVAAWRLNAVCIKASPDDPDDLIRLAHRKIHELSLINQVSGVLSSTLDMDKLLNIALEESLLVVGADVGSLMLVNEETRKLEIVASRGLARKWVEKTHQPVGQSIAGWVAEHGESVLVTNARKDPRFTMNRFRDNISSAASIPLKTINGVIGVLNVNTTKKDKLFDERDLELLGTVANQMAVAIENARLYARVNRRTKQLDSLLQMSKTITGTLNLDEVMRRLSSEICQLFQMDACVILLLDDLSGRFRFGHSIGLKSRRRYAGIDLAAPLASKVKAAKRKLVVKDLSTSRSLSTDISQTEGMRAAICFPLKNNGTVIGFAAAFAREERMFRKSQMDLMVPLGELAGVSISHARLYRQKYKIAGMLQQRLMPSKIPQIEGLEVGHKYLPAREVGGDYYDFIELGPRRIGIVMGDVSGNDVEAAEFTTMGKHVLRTYAREHGSPSLVLMKTNEQICEDTRSETFISLFYGTIDLESRKLCYSSAGCEPPLLYKARTGEVSVLRAEGLLLGIRCGVDYEEREIDLEPGDVLAVYTDGLTEAESQSRRYGAESVMKVLKSNAHLDAARISDNIYNALLDFTHGRVGDDTAIVVVKVI